MKPNTCQYCFSGTHPFDDCPVVIHIRQMNAEVNRKKQEKMEPLSRLRDKLLICLAEAALENGWPLENWQEINAEVSANGIVITVSLEKAVSATIHP
jgi:ADP-heptose:LPS heptosyltransferase